jgi:hypothetical protein
MEPSINQCPIKLRLKPILSGVVAMVAATITFLFLTILCTGWAFKVLCDLSLNRSSVLLAREEKVHEELGAELLILSAS